MVIINPSLLSADFCNLKRDIEILEKNSITSIHIDVMDGNFVSNIAFGIDQIKAISSITNMEVDVHMMVNNPEKYIGKLVEAGADCITLHEEACTHLYKTIYFIKSFGIKVGVALNPATNIYSLKYVFALLNRVLVMTVEPGFGGQKFIDSMKDKIAELRHIKEANQYNFEIQVDGGINYENIKDVVNFGANNVVIGSSIFKNGNIENNVKKFYNILQLNEK
ncbi:ribulose-phosphate 3-epimerase [Clostridium guangxiense]|uniref:ribulose-phosphate 3-epimerase n=1 Tax=Clostridium guangxiense TaxID=1662055 RepID=UPI001E29B5AE|nr:ribulose-phosphate 3-epimerase [Clostridium guangxiense]MCD2346917.1 ribulose-phosphate 3-epimerase [Clostridium guangxiense]